MKYSCEPCKYNTDNKNSYNSHLLTNRHKKKIQTIKCEYCNNVIEDKELIKRHHTEECIPYYKKILHNKRDDYANIIKECNSKLDEMTSNIIETFCVLNAIAQENIRFLLINKEVVYDIPKNDLLDRVQKMTNERGQNGEFLSIFARLDPQVNKQLYANELDAAHQ